MICVASTQPGPAIEDEPGAKVYVGAGEGRDSIVGAGVGGGAWSIRPVFFFCRKRRFIPKPLEVLKPENPSKTLTQRAGEEAEIIMVKWGSQSGPGCATCPNRSVSNRGAGCSNGATKLVTCGNSSRLFRRLCLLDCFNE